jgi:hypothetical protein
MQTRATHHCLILAGAVIAIVHGPTMALAEPVPPDKVRAAVTTWVHNMTPDARPTAIIRTLEPVRFAGQVMAYVAELEPEGFCLCGADDLVLPVQLYNPYGAYDASHPGYRDVLDEIAARTVALREALATADPQLDPYRAALVQRAARWSELVAGNVPAPAIDDSASRSVPSLLELPLRTKWSQDAPFNDDCPLGDGGTCVTGCVATAAAQIMRYWTWPPAGVGSESYTWNGDQSCGGDTPGDVLTGYFADSYDWANMPYEEPTGGYTTAQRAALAELSHEVGTAVHMDYGFCSSTSFTSAVADVLEDFFEYDSDTRYDDANIDDLTTELTWSRPVQMRGSNIYYAGHSFVVYGYDMSTDPDRAFLINMGHGTDWHVWYEFDSIPYNLDKEYVRQIAPFSVVRFVGASSSGDGSPDDPHRDIAEALGAAPDGATLVFQGGSTEVYPGQSLRIERPLTLRGVSVLITCSE